MVKPHFIRRNSEHPFSLLLIAGLLLGWSIIVVIGFIKVSEIPYIGMVLEGDAQNKQLIVRNIDEDAAAYKAGIRFGDRFIAIERVDGTNRYDFLGPEAFSGRQRIHSYQQHDEMLEAKRQLWEFVKQPQYILVSDSGEKIRVISETKRHFTSNYTLSILILAILFQSLLLLIISAGIFAFAKPSIGVTVLFVAGMGLSINTMANAFIVNREILFDPAIYPWVHLPSKAGSTAFRYALVCLVWYVPNPISRFPFWQVMLISGAFVYLAQTFQFFEFPVHPYELPNLALLPLGVAISIAQWQQSKNDPISRATTQWLMMSIYGAILVVVILYNVPLLFQQEPLINPLIASFILLFMFFGMALGTIRYRLFDVQKYWWRAVTWLLGGILVVLTDLLLISQFDFSQGQALPLALLLAGWAYFPMRQFILDMFVNSKSTKMTNHVGDLIDTFGGIKSEATFDQKFASFTQKVFNAKEIEPSPENLTGRSVICENGLGLSLPNVSNSGSLTLYGKADGKSLFSSSDEITADSFLKLIRNLKDIRLQEEQVLQDERGRIVRDLHDDVGGRLLSLIYKAPDKKMEEDARATLTALKESMIVIEDSELIDLALAWGQMMTDADLRLNEAGFTLEAYDNIRDTELHLTARQYVNIKRIVQEMISNAIKHGKIGTVKIHLNFTDDHDFELSCQNETKTRTNADILNGRGLGNIRKRLEEIGGQTDPAGEDVIAWENSKGNFTLKIRFPYFSNLLNNIK